jgi:hypothetical protein
MENNMNAIKPFNALSNSRNENEKNIGAKINRFLMYCFTLKNCPYIFMFSIINLP